LWGGGDGDRAAGGSRLVENCVDLLGAAGGVAENAGEGIAPGIRLERHRRQFGAEKEDKRETAFEREQDVVPTVRQIGDAVGWQP
jgi:hypothetical protein